MLWLSTYLGSTRGMSNVFWPGGMLAEQVDLVASEEEVPRKRTLPAAVLGTRCHWWRRAFVFVAEVDAAFGQIVGGHLYSNSIAGEDTNTVFLHSPRRVSKSFMPIVELYSKPGVGQELLYSALELDQVFLGQTDLLDKGTGAPRRPRVNIPPSP